MDKMTKCAKLSAENIAKVAGKNLPKCKQFCQVTAGMDLYGIEKNGPPHTVGAESISFFSEN